MLRSAEKLQAHLFHVVHTADAHNTYSLVDNRVPGGYAHQDKSYRLLLWDMDHLNHISWFTRCLLFQGHPTLLILQAGPTTYICVALLFPRY